MNRYSLNSLQRKTAGRSLIKEIDGMRFFAIILVMLFHLHTSMRETLTNNFMVADYTEIPSFISWIIIRLDLGVKFFFTLSGFILAYQFFNKRGNVSLKKYYLKRLRRLEPPYLISMALFLLIHVLFLDKDLVDYLYRFLLGSLYLHVPVQGFPNPINPVSWSLETEAQFYVILPWIFMAFYRLKVGFRILFLIILFSCGIAFRSLISTMAIDSLSNSIFSHLSHFIVGIAIAWLFIEKNSWFSRRFYSWDILYLISMVTMFYGYKPQHSQINLLIFNISVALMIVAIFKGKVVNWLFTRRVVFIIGGMCYSIYLLHYAFFHLAVPVFLNFFVADSMLINYLFLTISVIPITIIICAVFFIFVERPFMNS